MSRRRPGLGKPAAFYARPPLHLLRLDRKWRRAGVKDGYAKSENPATMRGEVPSALRAGFADFVRVRILDPDPPPQRRSAYEDGGVILLRSGGCLIGEGRLLRSRVSFALVVHVSVGLSVFIRVWIH